MSTSPLLLPFFLPSHLLAPSSPPPPLRPPPNPPPYRQTLRRSRVLENGRLERILVLIILPITKKGTGGGSEGSCPPPPFQKLLWIFEGEPPAPQYLSKFYLFCSERVDILLKHPFSYLLYWP